MTEANLWIGVHASSAAMAQEHGRNNGVESETLPRMFPLVQRMNDIRRGGTPDIEFAANGLLPLLDALEWSGNAKWHKRLMADVRAQAAIYPRFLQPRLSMSEALTAAEMQVLRLICADKSNAEIGEILNIRVSTVKSHVSSVHSKLGVNRSSETRTAAKKLWLISEDQ